MRTYLKTNSARMQSFASWPATSEQEPENLSNAELKPVSSCLLFVSFFSTR